MSNLKINDTIKALLPEFKETNSKLKIKAELLGTAVLNPFIKHNSSPRGLMMSSHVAQVLTLIKPDKKIIYTGFEEEFGEHAITKKFENDSEVITVIQRYHHGITPNPVEYLIVYRDLETNVIDVMEVPYFIRNHPYFGFKYIRDEEYLQNLFSGDMIPAGKIVARPPTLREDGSYGFGKNINVAFMTLDGVAEDGFIVSEEILEELKFNLYEHRAANISDEVVLLNIYGDDNNYKVFPEIGEEINSTSAVLAARKTPISLIPGLTSVSDSRTFNPMFDNVLYTRGEGGKVVDIKVLKNTKRKTLPKGTDVQLEKYKEALLSYHRAIVDVYNELNKRHKQLTGEDLIVSPEFTRRVVESLSLLNEKKIKKAYRKEEIDLYRAEFDIEYTVTPTIGFKLTTMHGGKGVIVQVRPRSEMPRDPVTGEVADVIMDPSSIISRLNIGTLYERYFGAASRKAKRMVVDFIKGKVGKDEITHEDVRRMSDDDVVELWREIVLPFLELFGTEQYEIFKSALEHSQIEDMLSTIEEIVEEEFYIHYNSEKDKEAWEIVLDIESSKFKPNYGPVEFVENGVKYRTKKPVMIAPMHMLLLNKIADSVLSVSSAKVNHFGLPIGVSKNDRYRLPWRNSPVRTVGETEGRLYASYGGREFLAELKDRGASIETHTRVYKNILKSEKPTNIDDVVDRNEHPYGTDRALENLETLFKSIGLDFKYVDDNHRYHEPTEKVNETLDIKKVETDEDEEGGTRNG